MLYLKHLTACWQWFHKQHNRATHYEVSLLGARSVVELCPPPLPFPSPSMGPQGSYKSCPATPLILKHDDAHRAFPQALWLTTCPPQNVMTHNVSPQKRYDSQRFPPIRYLVLKLYRMTHNVCFSNMMTHNVFVCNHYDSQRLSAKHYDSQRLSPKHYDSQHVFVQACWVWIWAHRLVTFCSQ